MSEPAPWRCPSCLTWLAPHVSEHRCDPPAAGVTVTPFAPSGAGGTSGALLPPVSTITVSTSGPVTSGRDLVTAVQRGMPEQANRSWRGGWQMPGRAA